MRSDGSDSQVQWHRMQAKPIIYQNKIYRNPKSTPYNPSPPQTAPSPLIQRCGWSNHYNRQNTANMKGKMPRKFKRYLTEPQEFSSENNKKYNNFTLKQLKLQVGAMDNLNDIYATCVPSKLNVSEKSINHIVPLQTKIQNKRNALKKLPELVNTPHFNNGNEEQRSIQNPALFKVNNPLFVVNTLLQIMKEDVCIQEQPAKEARSKKLELTITEKKKNQRNEFEEVTAKSVKIHRPPRILDHQLSRLTHQSNFSRRKIYSEEKSRPKLDKEIELLTFYKPKQKREQKSVEQMNQFL